MNPSHEIQRLETAVRDSIQSRQPINLWGPEFGGSEKRAKFVVSVIRTYRDHGDTELIWRTLDRYWASCDRISADENDEVLRILSSCGSYLEHLPLDDFRASIPGDDAPVTVYRGCPRNRVRSLSWSLCREVAEKFARGHRGIPVPDAVIATATIRGRDILFATDARDEREVLVDYRNLSYVTEEVR